MEKSFWVFAYGSLMWNPGFEPDSVLPARIYGYHRRFCLYSTNYRGTDEHPGLVLGLERGGSCTGLLMQVKAHQSEQVRQELWQREMSGGTYEAKIIPALPMVDTASRAPIPALAFVINRKHDRYAGKLCLDTQAALIAIAKGKRGSNEIYLSETVACLQKLGCCPSELVVLLEKVHQCCEKKMVAVGPEVPSMQYVTEQSSPL
ncbi:MAG: gamma-glutamylcyclotransferase [Alphaproteobacteria bacterium]|nr:gamma-glutamylcyclotransferase [Alphaproteobacteria bacterium]